MGEPIRESSSNQLKQKQKDKLVAITWKGDPDQAFTKIEQCGKGAFGEVYKAVHNLSGNQVAIKIFFFFEN